MAEALGGRTIEDGHALACNRFCSRPGGPVETAIIARSSSTQGVTSGSLCLASANIETAAVADRFLAGDSTRDSAADFAVDEREIGDAVRFEALLRAA